MKVCTCVKNPFTWSLLVAMKNMAFFSIILNQKNGPRSVKLLSVPTLKSATLMVKQAGEQKLFSVIHKYLLLLPWHNLYLRSCWQPLLKFMAVRENILAGIFKQR